jgi:thiamine monophosphate kinase
VRIELTLSSLPLADGVAEVADELGVEPRAFAATAGEDYELCVCVPARTATTLENDRGPRPAGTDARRSLRTDLTWVGLVVDGPPGVVFTDADGALSGFEHSF